jgi:hypothetical protein
VPYLTRPFQGFGTTAIDEMAALAVVSGSINLGQGFLEDDPAEVLDAALESIRSGQRWASASFQRRTVRTRHGTQPA